MMQDGQRKMFRIRRQFMRQILESNKKAQQQKNRIKKKQQQQFVRYSSNLNHNSMQEYYLSNQIENQIRLSHKQLLKQDYLNKMKQKQIKKYQQKLKQTKYALIQNQRQQHLTEKRIADMINVIDRKRYHGKRFNYNPNYQSFTQEQTYYQPQNKQININHQRGQTQKLCPRKKSLNNGWQLQNISTPSNIRKSFNIKTEMQDSYKHYDIPQQLGKNYTYAIIDYKQQNPIIKGYKEKTITQYNPEIQDYQYHYNEKKSPISNPKRLKSLSSNKYSQNIEVSNNHQIIPINLDKLKKFLTNKKQIKLDLQSKVIEVKQTPSKYQEPQKFYYMNVKAGHYRERKLDYKY